MMFFDDRLATVLRQRAASEGGLRTQFRQLLDILGNRTDGADGQRDHSLVSAAWLRMDALAEAIPAAERARMIREPGWRFRNAELAAHLANCEPEVASAALARADLSAEDWTGMIPRLPVQARGFLRLRNDLPLDAESLLDRLGVYDRGLPAPAAEPLADVQDAPDESGRETDTAAESDTRLVSEAPHDAEPDVRPAMATVPPSGPRLVSSKRDREDSGRSEISALVERIAQFRRNRADLPGDADRSPRLPLGEMPQPAERRVAGFGFATDSAGRIEWTTGEVAAMVIGTRLVTRARLGVDAQESVLDRAFVRRQPIIRAAKILAGAAAIAGDWIVDAQPRFTTDGNFAGYVGRFRRPVEVDGGAPSAAAREADRIRQLLHELRTPVTAVQGYAEVIQQQLFGPAPHEYRALAAAIAADAARILAGFEELDRLARLETGAIAIERGETDLAELVTRTVSQLAQVLGPRLAGIDFDLAPGTSMMITVDADDAEALIWRLLATLGGACAAGEMLSATLTPMLRETSAMARLTCELPAQLLAEDDIFSAEAKPMSTAINAGLFGAGFALRLARAEARAAGGTLVVDGETLSLSLPLLTAYETLPENSATHDFGSGLP